MTKERLLTFRDVPSHIQRSILQDLRSQRAIVPQQVILGMTGNIVRYYRPIYTYPSTKPDYSNQFRSALKAFYAQQDALAGAQVKSQGWPTI